MTDRHSSTGYTWLEFGRVDEQDDHFLTIGMAIRAVRGGPMKSWFFVTPRRVDESFTLKSIDGVPLTQRQLTDVLGDTGQVIESATDYRRVIDEKLFRLGERYEPLVDLLLQLRQPQLAKKLDIDQLEAALRGALPPLKEALLDDAAEAFRDLDHYRTSLAADRQMLGDVERFLRPYRDHVRRGVLRAIRQLTSANSRYETVQKSLRALAEKREQDKLSLETLSDRRQQARIDIESARAAVSELEQSPEMGDARRLDELRRTVDRLARQETDGQRDQDAAIAQQNAAEQFLTNCETRLENQFKILTGDSARIRKAAAPEALQNQHREMVDGNLAQKDVDGFQQSLRSLSEAAVGFTKSAKHLKKLDDAIEQARREREAARQNVQRLTTDAMLRSDALESSQQKCEHAVATTWQAILDWYESATLLRDFLPAIESWSDTWNAWIETADAVDPCAEILRRVEAETVARAARESTQYHAEIERIDVAIGVAEAETLRLKSGETIVPPTREDHDVSHREQLAGAPFWQLVDFRSEVPDRERGGWEAALQDSGILDAWVTPDGTVFDAGDKILDLQLLCDREHTLEDSRQLGCVLEAAEGVSKVRSQTIQRLLSVIGVGEDAGATWVANGGRWQNGQLRGQWAKPRPQFIGEETRQAFRESRIAELASELVQHDKTKIQWQEKLADVREKKEQRLLFAGKFPSRQNVVQTTFDVDNARREADAAQDLLQKAQQVEAERASEVDRRVARRNADADDLRLSAWASRVGELQDRLNEYSQQLSTLEAKGESLVSASSQVEHAELSLSQANERQIDTRARFESLQIELGKQRQRVRELEAAVGKDASEFIERLERKRGDLKTHEDSIDSIGKEISALDKSIAVTESKLEGLQTESNDTDERRRECADWFSSLHSHGLIELAVESASPPELPCSMTQAIKFARLTDGQLSGTSVDDEAWHRSQNKVHEAQTELQQTVLSQDGLAVEVDHIRDGLQLVTLTMQGERLAPSLAISRLKADIENRDRILDEKEQATLEKYLLGEVAEGLRSGMRMASELVDLMTREVSSRPMKTGLQMRFKWSRDADGPPGLEEACEVLATSSATWSPDERDQIKQFLQRCIRQSRESEASGSWHDHLRTALDYRLWHRIEIYRRSGPDASWQRLTRRTYGSGSGGEKAISLTLPQLAAAAAYYQTADKLAPRFILLDEAFAGVSPDMRESCMELIAAFKLDVVMTSEIEWGMYAGVRQLAICQLDRFADIGAVVNRVFIWNGKQLRDAKSRDEPTADEGPSLFGEEPQ
ncbi:TIGR02680 family protein [Rosistilla carotiformis]|nr:TIGR02680 family protein [Rosistilla carotiformis]